MLAAQAPAEGIALIGVAVFIEIQILARLQPTSGLGPLRQGAVFIDAVDQQWRQMAGYMLDVFAARRAKIGNQPGQQARHIGPAQEQGPVGGEQHRRGLEQNARRGHRDHRAARQDAAVAIGGGIDMARFLAVDHDDRRPQALQVQGAGNTDDTGADDGDSW